MEKTNYSFIKWQSLKINNFLIEIMIGRDNHSLNDKKYFCHGKIPGIGDLIVDSFSKKTIVNDFIAEIKNYLN